MHSPIKAPGMDVVLTPTPSVAGRSWTVTGPDGAHLGSIDRVRENPGTRRERTRWKATTTTGLTIYPLTTRREAVTQLTLIDTTEEGTP